MGVSLTLFISNPVFVSLLQLGAIGMFHPRDFPDDASSSIFWLPLARKPGFNTNKLNAQPLVQRMNNKFSLFAYVVDGGEVLRQLLPGDVITSVKVEEGVWRLEGPRRPAEYSVVESSN